MNKVFVYIFLLSLLAAFLLLVAYFYLSYSGRGLGLSQFFSSLVRTERQVTIETDIPGDSVSFKNKDALLNELETLGFWKENGVGVHDGQNVNWVTARNLRIVLTDKEQPWAGSYSVATSKKKSSFNISVDGRGNALLAIWIDREVVDGNLELSDLLSRELFLSFYTVTHWDNLGKVDSPYFEYLGNLVDRTSSGEIALPFVSVEGEQ